jgi:hypothetical protein
MSDDKPQIEEKKPELTKAMEISELLSTWFARIASLESRVTSLEIENDTLRDKVLRKIQVRDTPNQKVFKHKKIIYR